MVQLEASGLGFDYQIQYSSRRKTLEIQIKNGSVIVRCPNGIGRAEVVRFLRQKSGWITSKLRLQQQCLEQFPPRQYHQGATWWWMGEPVTLRLLAGPKNRVELAGNALCVYLSAKSRGDTPAAAQRLLEAWYKRQALALLSQKARAQAQQLNLQYHSVRVRKTKTRWGHCTAQGVLQFNWLIMQAPEPVIDYLVAHEVCHLQHFNHSQRFWALVASVCAGYQQHRLWLKQNGQGLWF